MTQVGQLNVDEAIEEAFARTMPPNFEFSTIGNQQIRQARRSIRLMLDDWNTDGVVLWRTATDQTQALTANLASFTPAAGTLDILQAAILRGTVRTPVDIISEDQFFKIPDRTFTSMVRKLCVRRQTEPPLCMMWPLPENATDILVYDALTYSQDSFSNLAGGLDLPRFANEAFVACLTTKLSEIYAPLRYQEKLGISGGPGINNIATSYGRMKMANRERGDTVMTVQRRA